MERFLTEDDYAALETVAEHYGREWATRRPWTKNKFSTYQIRGLIAEVERLRRVPFGPEAASRLRMLRPQVAYISRRYHDDELYEFARVLRQAIEIVGEDAARFTRFLAYWDALLAYFRANGGR